MLVRKLISVVFLVLFLFPAVQKELHTFSHKDDIACSARDTKHLHEQHHYCKYCDFSVPVHALLQVDQPLGLFNLEFITITDNYFSINNSGAVFAGPPRAPPFAFC